MVLISNLLDINLIPEIFQIWKNSTNTVSIDGEYQDRYLSSSTNGKHVTMGRFSHSEFNFIWHNIKSKLPEYQPVEYRILRYRTGGYMVRHHDGPNPKASQTNSSLVIQLSDLSDYKGGDVIVGKSLYELSPGDGIIYNYGEAHEVKKVTSGNRYVLNIRMLKE